MIIFLLKLLYLNHKFLNALADLRFILFKVWPGGLDKIKVTYGDHNSNFIKLDFLPPSCPRSYEFLDPRICDNVSQNEKECFEASFAVFVYMALSDMLWSKYGEINIGGG